MARGLSDTQKSILKFVAKHERSKWAKYACNVNTLFNAGVFERTTYSRLVINRAARRLDRRGLLSSYRLGREGCWRLTDAGRQLPAPRSKKKAPENWL
jgi:hypothetical protein